jgi:hypothetical protein
LEKESQVSFERMQTTKGRWGGRGALSAWLGLFWGLEEREVNYETCLLKRRYRLVEIDGSKELCLRGWL